MSTATLGANPPVIVNRCVIVTETGFVDPGHFAVGKWNLEPVSASTWGQREVTTLERV